MEKLKINTVLEGGIGDVLLGNRFVPAILEKYPNSEINAFLNTENNPLQEKILKLGYSRFYNSIQTIPSKKYKKFWVDTQFGPDEFYGAFENIPDDWVTKINDANLVFDLHIDSLKWMNYDFDWMRYMYFFPRPETPIAEDDISFLPEKFVVLQLVSESSGSHRMEQWWITNFINKIAKKMYVVVLSMPKINNFYQDIKDNPNVRIVNVNISSVFTIIEKCSLFIGTDSGIKFLSYGYSKPTIEFSSHSNGPHSMIISHECRWNLFPRRNFPLNYDISSICDCCFRILDDKAYTFAPNLSDLDNQLVRRKWTLNTEKSILNA